MEHLPKRVLILHTTFAPYPVNFCVNATDVCLPSNCDNCVTCNPFDVFN